jgi:hypothetical protein
MSESTVFVYTMNSPGAAGKWSRYVFPFPVDAFTQLGNDLYIRHDDEVSIVRESAETDEIAGVPTNFDGRVQWNWLDLGSPGDTAELEGFDMEGSGEPSISFGYDQRNTSAFTTPWSFDPDTIMGGIVPYPIMAPTLSVRMDFAGGTPWTLKRVILYPQGSSLGPG